MKLCIYLLFVLSVTSVCVDSLNDNDYDSDADYTFDYSPSLEDAISLQSNKRQKKFSISNLPRTLMLDPSLKDANGNECGPEGAPAETPAPSPDAGNAAPGAAVEDAEVKAKELRNLVQHLYIAQARVQLEATEIKKAQAVANSAQQALEEAANHVRTITAALQNAQQGVASAAIRAQTAQLQLAAHDQLLFAARQDVDALSSQMVGLQAAEGISAPKITVDLTGLLEKLKQPLSDMDRPTPVPSIVPMPTFKAKTAAQQQQQQQQQQQFQLQQQQAQNLQQAQLQQQQQLPQPQPLPAPPQSVPHLGPTLNDILYER